MEKDDAERALSIIRQVIQTTHEDLVAHNWGLIWIFHSFTNAAAFVAIGAWAEAGDLGIVWYLVPLAVVAAVNLVIVAFCRERDRGVQSFVEWQIHGIFTAFVIVSLASAAVLHLYGAPKYYCPLIALNASFSFAVMGVVFYRSFFAIAALFMAAGLAAPFAGPVLQWYCLAAAWWLALIIPGVLFHLEKLRRHDDDQRSQIL